MHSPIHKFLYKFNAIRQLGKKLWKHKIISQPFHNGVICFNAVDFGFLWLKGASAQKIDPDIQDKLLALSKDNEYFIDIGANVGIMTLAVALRNQNIKIVAYDPNREVLAYLEKSIRKNKLGDRVTTSNAAVSNKTGTTLMNFSTGPYSGHISDQGTTVPVVDFADVLKKYADNKTLFKMDIEGFEKLLVPYIVKDKNPNHTFVIEVHPHGLNGISDPDFVLEELFANNFTLSGIDNAVITSRKDIIDWSNVVCSYEINRIESTS